jgi:hypothetical protein
MVRRCLKRATVHEVAARSHMKALQPREKVSPLFDSPRMQRTRELLAWSEDWMPKPWHSWNNRLKTRVEPYSLGDEG